jgi:hypothetical protein
LRKRACRNCGKEIRCLERVFSTED